MEGKIWNGAPSIPIPCVEMEFQGELQMCNSRCGVELHTWNCVALRALRTVRTYVRTRRKSMELCTVHIILYVSPWNMYPSPALAAVNRPTHDHAASL